MTFARLLLKLLLIFVGAILVNAQFKVDILSAFSFLFGIFLFHQLINSLGKVIPFFELTFGFFGIQLLVAPFLDYYYFQNDGIGFMSVDEQTYFSFVTYAILAIYLGYSIIPKKNNEYYVKDNFKQYKKQFEYIGEILVWVGYSFYFLSFVVSNFIIITFAFLRFIGSIYLLLSESKKRWVYTLLVWLPFFFVTIKSAVFINLIIWIALLYSLFALTKKVKILILYSYIIITFFFLLILQSVKFEYRGLVWEDNNVEDISLVELMINKVRDSDFETLRDMLSGLNIRVNQGWIISNGLNNLNSDQYHFKASYFFDEMIGILLPRFLYSDKASVGSHEKFYDFAGYQLSDSTAMNLGIIGDAYLNFGLGKGIFACFLLGLIFGLLHKYFLQKLKQFPDLLAWSFLFYFFIMRAGNEFYIIMNWYVKTGLITIIFFMYVRPYLMKRFKRIKTA
jgi:hypothetical protein